MHRPLPLRFSSCFRCFHFTVLFFGSYLSAIFYGICFYVLMVLILRSFDAVVYSLNSFDAVLNTGAA